MPSLFTLIIEYIYLSKNGFFGKVFDIQMPTQILKDLQLFSKTYTKSDQGRNYVLKNLKLMTSVLNQRKDLVRIDQIFYILIRYTHHFYHQNLHLILLVKTLLWMEVGQSLK